MSPEPRSGRHSARPFDLVLLGATGYTGRLVAAYLAPRAGPLRWALAGRNPAKLEEVRRGLAALDRSAAGLPLLQADSGDQASLDALARQARVICSTVGPYARHGSGLVAACARHGTDYCDLTGEVQWMRRMIDEHHEEARRSGAHIVHACGYDAIPSDLGTLMVQDHALRSHGAPCGEVRTIVGESRGGFSGGTFASMLNLLEEARRDPTVRRLLADPYALNPEGERGGADGPDQRAPGYDPALRRVTGPSIMAPVNTRVVRRSHALLGWPWGRTFRYREIMGLGRGVGGALATLGLTAGLGLFGAALLWGPTRSLLVRRLPAPGEGPTPEQRRRGYFRHYLVGEGRSPAGQPFLLKGLVVGQSDPGYGETAKMLGESALCLALDREALPAEGGVLTPASCMGMRLIERLRTAGMTFAVGQEGAGAPW